MQSMVQFAHNSQRARPLLDTGVMALTTRSGLERRMATSSVPDLCAYCYQEMPPLSSQWVIDLSGKTFGRLHVNHFAYTKRQKSYWCCSCACGSISVKRGTLLRVGNTQSCGCLQRERRQELFAANTTHHRAGTVLYTRWTHMIGRCTNPKNAAYADYGGRGITICPQWRASFETFARDMGEPPPGKHIERRDNDGPYSPENCYWASRIEQANNKRNNRWLTYDGITLTLAQWSRMTGLRHHTILHRLAHGWTLERALTTPVRHRKE